MNWLLQNWQTVAALAVVGATLAVFAVRLLRPGKRSNCGGDCGCSMEASTLTGESPPRAGSPAQSRSNSR